MAASVSAILVVTLLTPLGLASAESPLGVAEELAVDGVYVAPRRQDIEEEPLIESIRRARARGLRLVVTAPVDPTPDAQSFARRVLEASDADASIVFPTEGGLEIEVIDEFESASFRAFAAARSKATPEAAVDAFTTELLAEPARTMPKIVRRVAIAVLLLAAILAGAVAIEQVLRRIFRRGKVDIEPVGSKR